MKFRELVVRFLWHVISLSMGIVIGVIIHEVWL